MLNEEQEILDEKLNNEIFEILIDNDIKSYKEFKKLNIIDKLLIQNNIISLLKMDDALDGLKNETSLKGYIKGFIDVYKSF